MGASSCGGLCSARRFDLVTARCPGRCGQAVGARVANAGQLLHSGSAAVAGRSSLSLPPAQRAFSPNPPDLAHQLTIMLLSLASLGATALGATGPCLPSLAAQLLPGAACAALHACRGLASAAAACSAAAQPQPAAEPSTTSPQLPPTERAERLQRQGRRGFDWGHAPRPTHPDQVPEVIGSVVRERGAHGSCLACRIAANRQQPTVKPPTVSVTAPPLSSPLCSTRSSPSPRSTARASASSPLSRAAACAASSAATPTRGTWRAVRA